MIGFFPKPYQNEIYFSIIARYDRLSGNTGRQTFKELLCSNSSLKEEYPIGLSNFVKNIEKFSSMYTEKYFLRNHTNLPFFEIFHSRVLIEDMKMDNYDKPYRYLRSRQQKVKKIKVCEDCLRETKEQYGDVYINRVHQLPGVLVCPTHKIPLSYIRNHIGSNLSPKYCIPNVEDINELESIPVSNSILKELILYESDVRYIVEKKNNNFNLDMILEKFIELLKVLGLAYPQKKRVRNVKEVLEKCYSEELLSYLGLRIDNIYSDNWISKSLRKGKKFSSEKDYIAEIILMRALAGSVKAFFEEKVEHKPFGDGPWMCMNPFCENYKIKNISNIEIGIHTGTGLIYGDIKCSCGFIYRLRENEMDPFKVPYFTNRILEKGDIWIGKVHELRNLNYSQRAISEMAGVSIPTIYKALGKKNVYRFEGLEKQQNEKTMKYKEMWIKLRNENLKLNRNELSEKNRAAYAWLRNYAPDWLEEHLPPSKKGTNSFKRKLDISNVVEEIEELYSNWRLIEIKAGRPVKRGVEQLKSYIKLPKGYGEYNEILVAIENFIESRLEFRKRRIDFFLKNEYKNQFVKPYMVAESAIVKAPIRLGDKELEKYLHEAIEEHNSNIPSSNL